MKLLNFTINTVPLLKIDTVCIGKFDGMHKGHKALLNKAKSISDDFGILTFNPPPFVYFQNGAKVLFTQKERESIMRRIEIPNLLTLKFNSTLAHLDGEEFCEKISPIAKTFIIGEDFCYGKGRKWNAIQMKNFGKIYGFDVQILPTIPHEGIAINSIAKGDSKISSGILKSFVRDGNFTSFNQLALCMFFVEGEVLHGKKIASSVLGFSTANMIFPQEKISIPFGVYATLTKIDNQIYQSISNFGVKPTLELHTPTLETHILNFNEDIYGRNISVFFLQKIREEEKFSDINQLKFQIFSDIDVCKKIHKYYENYPK